MERQRTPFLAPARATEGDGEAEDERRSPALDLLSARGTRARALARTLARPRVPLVVVVIVVIGASAVVQSSRGARARRSPSLPPSGTGPATLDDAEDEDPN